MNQADRYMVIQMPAAPGRRSGTLSAGLNQEPAGQISYMCSSAQATAHTKHPKKVIDMRAEGMLRKGQSKKIVRSAGDDGDIAFAGDRGSFEFFSRALADISSQDLERVSLTDDAGAVNSGVKDTQRPVAPHAFPRGFSDERDILEWCFCLAAAAPAGRSLLKKAESCGWSVGIGSIGQPGFYLNTLNKRVILDNHDAASPLLCRSAHLCHDILISFIKALREIWQEEALSAQDSSYKPEDMLMLERLRAADADMIGLLVGWQLRSAGYPEIWRHILGSEDSDIALCFSEALGRDPRALYDGRALAEAFRQWFGDQDRVNAADTQVLEQMDGILDDSPSSGFAFGKKRLSPEQVESLSGLPGGGRYLKGVGQAILSDPAFAGLCDPINQAHLFQIVYDLEVVMIKGVPFRSRSLARKFFPEC